MTVTELIEMLQDLPGDVQVIMSKDGEGNSFSPMSDSFSLGMYESYSTWSGEFTTKEWFEDDPDHYEGVKYNENAVVLWPVN